MNFIKKHKIFCIVLFLYIALLLLGLYTVNITFNGL
ncbi:hypothetical protein J2S08_002920 [Bacillus chungangensis]|uniref:Uncharacterized protein n=1 Tax=Bacillus chungangensis TaxID=587633 RepID=A0ABT9WUR0_9BACI|nr:hypothetical protein [Bacillus chungangensis]